MIEKISVNNELARDSDAVIAAERLHSTYKELIIAGFTPQEAMLYLGTLVATLTFLKNQSRHITSVKKGE